MRVIVIFEFEGIEPNSGEADKIIEDMTEECETMRIAFDASNCWIDDCVAWIDEAERDEDYAFRIAE
jgi:hypothetical protein